MNCESSKPELRLQDGREGPSAAPKDPECDKPEPRRIELTSQSHGAPSCWLCQWDLRLMIQFHRKIWLRNRAMKRNGSKPTSPIGGPSCTHTAKKEPPAASRAARCSATCGSDERYSYGRAPRLKRQRVDRTGVACTTIVGRAVQRVAHVNQGAKWVHAVATAREAVEHELRALLL